MLQLQTDPNQDWSVQCLLRSKPPESEIEIELERTWEASRVDLEMVWTRV